MHRNTHAHAHVYTFFTYAIIKKYSLFIKKKDLVFLQIQLLRIYFWETGIFQLIFKLKNCCIKLLQISNYSFYDHFK